jgi:hypothetical protein
MLAACGDKRKTHKKNASFMLFILMSMALFGVIAMSVIAIPCSLDSTGITTCSDHGHDIPMGLVRYLCIIQCGCLLFLTPVILLPDTLLLEMGKRINAQPLLVTQMIMRPPKIFS